MIKFTKSPTGAFNLGYNAGDTATLGAELEKKCIEAGVAVPADVAEEPVDTKKKIK